MLMNTPMHCLEGLLVSRVDEQQMHWLTEWIIKQALPQPAFVCRLQKHSVVIPRWYLPCQAAILVSLFQPKTATIEDIAIALVKMFDVAAWRRTRDI